MTDDVIYIDQQDFRTVDDEVGGICVYVCALCNDGSVDIGDSNMMVVTVI